MLTVLIGTDREKRTAKLEALSAKLEKSGADIQVHTDVSFDPDLLRTIAETRSLFGGKSAVIITGIGDRADTRDAFEKIIPTLAASEQEFFLSENSLLAPFLKKVTAAGGTVEVFDQKVKTKKAEAFNVFLLTDAFSDRKRSHAWALYRSAIGAGLDARELHGKIFWAVKTMLIAESAKSAGESGLNPFVYQKAKRAAKNFASGELTAALSRLAALFHEALVSGIDLETALEALLLRTLAK